MPFILIKLLNYSSHVKYFYVKLVASKFGQDFGVNYVGGLQIQLGSTLRKYYHGNIGFTSKVPSRKITTQWKI